jgi:site-specific recombinase XerD
MLKIYRRHRKSCNHRAAGRSYRRCQCPIWVDGTLGHKRVLKSLNTRDWDTAFETSREWELAGQESANEDDISVETATAEFIADAEARELHERTIYKYRFLFRQMCSFCEVEGITRLRQLDVRLLRKFRTEWKDHNLAALKKLERLRSFYRFAISNKWVEDNPAKSLKSPSIEDRRTLPYSNEEMFRILSAVETWIAEAPPQNRDNARRLRALIFLLRYSGLRIGDAVGCSTNLLTDGKLRLHTQKTGSHVYVPLPPFVVAALDACPRMSESYWFWTGNGKLSTAVGDWQGRLLNLSSIAKVGHLHAHRFRDTFAVALLLEGVPVERIAILLGHSSIKVTEKHYSPWIRERQEQAESDVRATWAHDPVVALAATNDTRLIHGKSTRAN